MTDLRLCHPWSELEEFSHSFDLSAVDDITHKHIPFACLLIQAAAAWKKQNKKEPGTSKERSAFKQFIKDMKRKVHLVLQRPIHDPWHAKFLLR